SVLPPRYGAAFFVSGVLHEHVAEKGERDESLAVTAAGQGLATLATDTLVGPTAGAFARAASGRHLARGAAVAATGCAPGAYRCGQRRDAARPACRRAFVAGHGAAGAEIRRPPARRLQPDARRRPCIAAR